MTRKERMLAAISGAALDRIPWAPRLDLWYRANRLAGTLPAPYRNATLMELTDDLGWGFHAIIPDFRDLRSSLDDADRILGIYNLWSMPCRTVLEEVRRTVTPDGDRTRIEYQTPVGTVSGTVLYDQDMRRAGVSITHVETRVFKSAADYAPLIHLFRHARVEPNPAGYAEFQEQIGERGLAAGFVSLAASPMHLIQRDFMPLDLFFYEMADHPAELAELAEAIGGYWRQLLAVAAEIPAELFLLGANYDAAVTFPPFFREQIRPWLKTFADRLHSRGKFLLTHTDGENSGLLQEYLESGIDVADSVCPVPMTRLTFRQHREAFAGRIAIMGGIPSVALLPECMPEAEFNRFIDRFFAEAGQGERLILGISDTTPPGAAFSRLLTIARRIEAFGPVRLRET